MTTFVLHGGATSKNSLKNNYFFRQFTDLIANDPVKILMCYWARPNDQWQTLLDRDKSKILKQTSKQVSFSLANDPKDLLQKIKDHHVVYIAGGAADLIEPLLPQLNKLRDYLEGKIFIGSSMGAFIAAKHYVLSSDEQDSNSVHHGIGLVPYGVLCHWNVEDKQQTKLNLLKQENPELPILTLDEEKFIKLCL